MCLLEDARESCGGLRVTAGEGVMKSSAHQRLLHYCYQSRWLPLQLEGMRAARAVIGRHRQECKVLKRARERVVQISPDKAVAAGSLQ